MVHCFICDDQHHDVRKSLSSLILIIGNPTSPALWQRKDCSLICRLSKFSSRSWIPCSAPDRWRSFLGATVLREERALLYNFFRPSYTIYVFRGQSLVAAVTLHMFLCIYKIRTNMLYIGNWVAMETFYFTSDIMSYSLDLLTILPKEREFNGTNYIRDFLIYVSC